MKLFIILVSLTAVLAHGRWNQAQRNFMRDRDQLIGNSDSVEGNDEELKNNPYGTGGKYGNSRQYQANPERQSNLNDESFVTLRQYQANPEAYNGETDDGQWVEWMETMDVLPWFAVSGGYHEHSLFFVMRANHDEKGRLAGKVVGNFDRETKQAFITFGGQRLRTPKFELLVHRFAIWADKNEDRPKVPGGTGYICRAYVNDGKSLLIGDLSKQGTCTVWFNDNEIKTTNYQYLAVSRGD